MSPDVLFCKDGSLEVFRAWGIFETLKLLPLPSFSTGSKPTLFFYISQLCPFCSSSTDMLRVVGGGASGLTGNYRIATTMTQLGFRRRAAATTTG